MRNLTKHSQALFRNYWFILFAVIIVAIFFWKTIVRHLIPLPADFVVGTYYPWLDYKWGYEVGVPVKNPITSDVVSVIYPLKTLAMEMVTRGELPLWNPYMFGGYPLLANMQIGIFSPTSFLYLLLPQVWAWSSQVMLQPFLAVIFTYLFLRQIGFNKWPAFSGGVIYAFSGFNIIWLEWNAHSLAGAFIPFILLCLDKYLSNQKIHWCVLFALGIALQIFSGYPQLFIYTIMAVLLLLYFRKSTVTYRRSFEIFLFLLLGLGLTAIQVVPAIELFKLSQRTTEMLSHDLIFMPWRNLLTFIAPDYFGNHSTGNFWGVGNYTNNAGYTGLITIICAFYALRYSIRNNYTKLFLSMLLISLVIALPNPVSLFISKLPFFGAASNTRILVLVNLSLSCLAAKAIDIWWIKPKKVNLDLLVGWILLWVLILILTWYGWSSTELTEKIHYFTALRNLFVPSVFLFLGVGLIVLFKKTHSKLFLISLSVLIFVELYRFGWKYTPFSPISLVFPETPVVNFLNAGQQPFRTLFGDTISMNMWIPYRLESLAGYDAVYPKSAAKYIAVMNSGNTQADPQGRHGTVSNYSSRLLDLANNRYLVVLKRDDKGNPSPEGKVVEADVGKKYTPIFEDRSVVVLENAAALPRAFMVYDWEVEKTENAMLDKLLQNNFPLQQKIILDSEIKMDKNFSRQVQNSVVYENYSASSSVLSVTTVQPGILFISDLDYPGWKAYVNNKEVEIVRADYLFKAIQVPQGASKIELVYKPESLIVGKNISLASLIIVTGIQFFSLIGKKPNMKYTITH